MIRTTLLIGLLLVLSSCAPSPPMVTVTYVEMEEYGSSSCVVALDGSMECKSDGTKERHRTEQMPVAVFDVRMTHDKAFRDSVLSFQ